MYNSKGGKLPKNPTKQDILLDLLKINRAIYYQLKTFTDGQIIKDKLKLSKIKALASQTERMKKDLKERNNSKGKDEEGSGLSDDYDANMLKNVNYDELKKIIED